MFSSIYIRSNVNVICDALSMLMEKDSAARIKGVDEASSLCCSAAFDDSLVSFRNSYIKNRAEGIPMPSLHKKFSDSQGVQIQKYLEYVELFHSSRAPIACTEEQVTLNATWLARSLKYQL